MSWTYTPGVMEPRDQVRFHIGDTLEAFPQLQDEEIAFLLTTYGTPYQAAIQACLKLAAKYAREVNRAVSGDGGVRVDAGERAQHYKDLAATLRTEARQSRRVAPFAGGISKTQKEATVLDTDRVPPSFGVDPDTPAWSEEVEQP